jgi:ATP-dependent DNA ligase
MIIAKRAVSEKAPPGLQAHLSVHWLHEIKHDGHRLIVHR